MTPKTASASTLSQTYLLMPSHMNGAGVLFGGQIMSWIDQHAGIVAMRHCGGKVVTACIDHLDFKEPAASGDMITLVGTVTWTGHTSIEVRVDTYKESFTSPRRLINSAFLVMVAIDDNGRPTEVPPLELKSEAEIQEWTRAEKRAELRKIRRNADL